MLGASAALVFLDAELRLLQSSGAQGRDVMNLPNATRSRLVALRTNVQRIIDALRTADGDLNPIFGDQADKIEGMRGD
jgi:hypothetical protein